MPTQHIIAMLAAERDKLNRAIEVLQRSAKRRGRPPKSAATTAAATVAKKRKRRSAAQRKAQAERMKAYWAAKRKKAK